jgi:hypothetical protein
MKSRTIIPRQILVFIVILALSSQACSISLIDFSDWFPTSPANTPAPSTVSTPMPRAEVTFTVQLPEPLTPGEVLALSVLDEVTGLALNAVDYQMSPLDTTTYTAKLAIPDKAVIRYRYVRIGSGRILEDTNTDAAIRYRLFLVNGPTQIVDTVSSWSDRPVNTVSGNIFGTVLNSDTGAPVPDIMVAAGGVQIQTDSAGRF